MYYVYVLQAKDDAEIFYVGCTSDLKKRFNAHNTGQNKSTKTHQWTIVYYEAWTTLSAARTREHRLKHNGKAKYQLLKRIKDSLGEG